MDIEHLNKFQLVLLALLVSFVTSIATGIVTVTLLAQAPPAVTETINNVVWRTVETVVPQAATSTRQTTQTIIVKEEDLITGSIASALQKTGRVFGSVSTTSPVVALAAEIAPGVLITDAAVVSPEDHLVSLGGVEAIFSVSQSFPTVSVAVLTLQATSTALAEPFRVGDTDAVRLGATVTTILSVSNERVAIGSVSAKFQLATVTKGAAPGIPVRAVDTTLDASSIPGAPLINIFGDLVGITTGVSQTLGGRGAFVSASDIIAVLAAKATATTTPSN